MDWKQFGGSAVLVGCGLAMATHDQYIIGLMMIGIGLWNGPFQKEFWG